MRALPLEEGAPCVGSCHSWVVSGVQAVGTVAPKKCGPFGIKFGHERHGHSAFREVPFRATGRTKSPCWTFSFVACNRVVDLRPRRSSALTAVRLR